MLRILLSSIVVCILAGGLVAEMPCDIDAGINNVSGFEGMTTDRTSTNIRKGPGTKFDISRTIKSGSGWIFHIVASDGNWMRIANYREIGGSPSAVAADGWVYAPSLFVKFDSEGKGKKAYGWLFTEPSPTSKHVLTKREMETIDINFASLLSCQGTWAKVTWSGHTGWLARGDQCSDLWDICGEK